ncbi:hypothetical protein DMENIID0001_077930 [Sergentomyia squamirostris]
MADRKSQRISNRRITECVNEATEEENLRYETVSSALEYIIVTSRNSRFQEKCCHLLMPNGGTTSDLKQSILMHLYQQALNRNMTQ